MKHGLFFVELQMKNGILIKYSYCMQYWGVAIAMILLPAKNGFIPWVTSLCVFATGAYQLRIEPETFRPTSTHLVV